MLVRLILLFTVVPLVELALLLWLASLTDWWFTLCLVVLTGIVGAWLARWQGFRAWRRIQDELAAGRLPTDSLLDGLMILVAAAVLVTPGVLTDLFGFALLVPPFRAMVKRYLAGRFKARLSIHTQVGGRREESGWAEHDEIIDVHVIDVDSRPPKD